ncbi:reverse transcriptase/maturase family protein [Tengunoibacter tsumagoiensis]|uniref:Maturase n=1 Tax=Tengunoibacter tsumagoiensis TaxID=2014871 RepID=A0A402A8X5_9CHLR|nr:reverse transcriptase/maturase family protein [Tengunoibacter tsumagoiensis]GCE14769.1 maturase [Tengunoibacter tsumagoiensis]GCE15401.1 maturase [Tengunoibacter tsumagoiensis]
MREAETILALIRERGKKKLNLERVYKLLYNPNLYLMAYGKIYRNNGVMTHGVTQETPDGMSLEKIDTIIELVRNEKWQWLPARRTYIPKKNGKKRPLGMPVWSDKLVQEVLRLILEAYYEPQFSDHSHGFRPGRSCATALREIHKKWSGVTWFIEGDISQCFDKLDHGLILNTISEKVHDGRLLRLLRGLLDAGYMENWTYNTASSGVPQGGIISPLLANILLNKLDTYVENVLVPRYNSGVKRGMSGEYKKLVAASIQARRMGNIKMAKELRKQFQKLPSLNANDPNFRRLKYVRYADDFLLGFIGSKAEAEEIKQHIGTFLREELKLELSDTKTLITHARTEAARFLGYEVTTRQEDTKHRSKSAIHGTKGNGRSINGRIGLRMPKDVLREKCKRYMRNGKARQRSELINESDYAIVSKYQLEYRGIVNYYRLAFNLHTASRLRWIMQTSLLKTLADKHKTTVNEIVKKHEVTLMVDGVQYKGLQVKIPRYEREPLVATWGGVSLKWDIKAPIEERPPKIWNTRTELVKRLLAQFCELCGDTENLEVHHIRAMKKLYERPGREKPAWVRRMIELRRKTLVLCKRCHVDVEHGLPLKKPGISLAEIKSRRQHADVVRKE